MEANPGAGVLTAALLKHGAVDVRALEYRSKWQEKMEVRNLIHKTKACVRIMLKEVLS